MTDGKPATSRIPKPKTQNPKSKILLNLTTHPIFTLNKKIKKPIIKRRMQKAPAAVLILLCNSVQLLDNFQLSRSFLSFDSNSPDDPVSRQERKEDLVPVNRRM